MEQVGHRTRVRHVAAVFAKHVPDFADRAVAVVGTNLNQDSRAAWAIAFEREFLVVYPGQFAGAALSSALDVVGRHVLGFGRRDGGAQTPISIRIAASG